jgi:hypothetical protein
MSGKIGHVRTHCNCKEKHFTENPSPRELNMENPGGGISSVVMWESSQVRDCDHFKMWNWWPHISICSQHVQHIHNICRWE